jgi:hypothetical protein
MSENVGASNYCNRKGLHGLCRDKFAFEWYKLFSEGRDKIEFDSRPGNPTVEIVRKMRTLV